MDSNERERMMKAGIGTGADRKRGRFQLGAWVRPGIISLALVAFATPSVEAQEEPRRTALDGVYSEAQAQRGGSTFRSSCGYCHTAAEFSGDHFRRMVSGDQVYWFYEYIRFNMPQDAPGALPAQSYADILAYILELNEFPAGNEDLPAEPSVLRSIEFPVVQDR